MTRAIFQAGLSWAMIAACWEAFRVAFVRFDVARVVQYGESIGLWRLTQLSTPPNRSREPSQTQTCCSPPNAGGCIAAYIERFATYPDVYAVAHQRFALLGRRELLLLAVPEPAIRCRSLKRGSPRRRRRIRVCVKWYAPTVRRPNARDSNGRKMENVPGCPQRGNDGRAGGREEFVERKRGKCLGRRALRRSRARKHRISPQLDSKGCAGFRGADEGERAPARLSMASPEPSTSTRSDPRYNRSKINSRSAGAIPGPRSLTVISTPPAAPATRIAIGDPGAYLIALSMDGASDIASPPAFVNI
jgi:hypothetical protein